MCCCHKPNVNGTPGYHWNNSDPDGVHPVDPPSLAPGDTLLYDEPGRCGGLDCHSHHLTLVENCGLYLLVKNGGGTTRLYVSCAKTLKPALAAMDSNARYWVLFAIYYAHKEAERTTRNDECLRWKRAAIENRIKVSRRGKTPNAWIE